MNLGFDLDRFLDAQATVYDLVLDELNNGRKRTHWMWFIFPQAAGLGESQTSRYYSIRSFEHASNYLEHSILGSRLIECTKLVNGLKNQSAVSIFGRTDALKFRSCITLFNKVLPEARQFSEALDEFYDGAPDTVTLGIVEAWHAQTHT